MRRFHLRAKPGIVALALAAYLILGLLPAGAAAANPVEQAVKGAGYSAILYNANNGLPTSDANYILQTAEGFIWIGNYSGLVRYDGNTFYRYSSATGVSSVVSLFSDSRNRLWVGTNDSGVGILENNEFTFYGRESGLRSLSIRSIAEDDAGNILIATTMGMAYVDPEGAMHILDDPQINSEYVCELERGADGTWYAVTNNGAVFTVKDLRVTGFYSPEVLGHGIVNTVLPDPEKPGWVYLGTQNSRVVYGPLDDMARSGAVAQVGPLTVVNAIRVLDGNIWLCADNGVGYLDADWKFNLLENLPMTNSIDHLMADYEGNLWFTSSRQGVMKIVPNRFTDISEAAGLPALVVNTTCRVGDELFIGADSGLVILDRDYRQTSPTPLTELLQGVRIRCIRTDSRGDVWLSTNSDLGQVRYTPADGSIVSYNTENGLVSNRARTTLELRDGTVAVATNGGVNLIRDGEIADLYDAGRGISNTEILTLEEGPNGELYMGSDGDGIYVARGGSVSRLGWEDGLSSEVILRLKRDPDEDGLYWVITSNSIGWMRDEKITTVRSFPYSNNFDVYFDDDGRLWILSSAGVYVVKREDMLSGGEIEYTLYDTKCGLPCTSTANSFSQLDADGSLFISASAGVSRVNIYTDSEIRENVRLAVPFLMADDAYIPVPEDGVVELPAAVRRLSIHAYAFTYSLNNPRLRYSLEGFDETPMEVNRQELGAPYYTNLPGGEYVFRLSAVNTVTGAEEQTLEITIVKAKTLTERPAFWAAIAVLGGLAVAGAVTAYFRRKTRLLLAKQEEHKKYISEITRVFAKCIDMKDHYTNGHSQRVAKYTAMLAAKLGKTPEEVDEIYHIALLHDIGKISIPDAILNKPGKLDEGEYSVMKSHSSRGYSILQEVDIDPELAIGAGYHHERMDGKGYPKGLKGEEIPEIARIIAVADTFDAMYSTRPYRKQLPLDRVAAEIERSAGTQLDPRVVEAFLALVKEGAFDQGPETAPAGETQEEKEREHGTE